MIRFVPLTRQVKLVEIIPGGWVFLADKRHNMIDRFGDMQLTDELLQSKCLQFYLRVISITILIGLYSSWSDTCMS